MGAERGTWLADEHAAPFQALGTILGAYWSGEIIARNFGSCYRLCDDPGYDAPWDGVNEGAKEM